MDTTSPSSTEAFKEPNFDDTLNDQDLFRMVYNTSLPRSEGISSFSQGLQQNTLWNGSMHYQGIISGSHDPCLDKLVLESQSLDPLLKVSDKSTIRYTIGKHQDQKMFKINQKQHKIMKLNGSKPSKKSNSIKGQWTSDEDTKLIDWIKQKNEEMVRHRENTWRTSRKTVQGEMALQSMS
ncbi:unnamed protein product [Arabis nemorensis]|uniref:Uncharacterized protein n=1 Tax=Arabis nemorensis TaxID=586526 RepID=A0A565BLU5_9BRAS|nr:unnamed protein product [Arabis nemorensis]